MSSNPAACANFPIDHSALRSARGARPAPKAGLAPALGAFAQPGYFAVAAGADFAAAPVAACAAGLLVRLAGFAAAPGGASAGAFGAAIAVIAVAAAARRGDYDLSSRPGEAGGAGKAFAAWNAAFGLALALAFVFGRAEPASGAELAAIYALGGLNFVMARRAVGDLARFLYDVRLAAPRRLVVVGFEDRLAEIARAPSDFGGSYAVSAVIALRDHESYLADDLALACAAARMHRADAVYLALPWSRPDAIEAACAAFLRTPVEIHLEPDPLIARLSHARANRSGPAQALTLSAPRRTRFERLQKRMFDIVVAGAGLVALAPVLLTVAALVRLDSPGPALFRQTRYGFNLEPFRIFKFRSMRAMENGAKVVAAKRNDPRVTRLGALLRRLSIDELPQLLNVLIGEMSIVGPRPHAMAHDQIYFEKLGRYARRHNVKPGITGWAQVHGHRGEIANDCEMLARLEHDLYYVDNWSLWLDIKIVLMTVFSPKAHSNAF